MVQGKVPYPVTTNDNIGIYRKKGRGIRLRNPYSDQEVVTFSWNWAFMTMANRIKHLPLNDRCAESRLSRRNNLANTQQYSKKNLILC